MTDQKVVMTDQKPGDLVYTPNDIARLTMAEIDRRRSDTRPGVTMGLMDVDKRMNPLRAGELTIIIGRPGCYKSGLAQWWARTLAEQMRANEESGIVVYTTCEMAIEELGIYDLTKKAGISSESIARGDVTDEQYAQLKTASMHRVLLPLWFLGHSIARRRKRLRTSVFDIEQSLYHVEDAHNERARIIFLDYLNLMDSNRRPGEGYSSDQRMRIIEIVKCAKDMAIEAACPVVMLAQAHRRVDERSWKLPYMHDAMESAALEQMADKMFSVWMPMATDKMSNITTPDGRTITPDQFKNTLILGFLKQKNGMAGGYTKLYVDPATNTVGDWSGTW